MREDGGWDAIIAGCEALGKRVDEHIANYGVGIEDRLTGAHETAHYTKFSYGTSDRGASVRIPWEVAKDKKGWLEDRRPNANMDPYVVTAVMVETVCGDAAGQVTPARARGPPGARTSDRTGSREGPALCAPDAVAVDLTAHQLRRMGGSNP